MYTSTDHYTRPLLLPTRQRRRRQNAPGGDEGRQNDSSGETLNLRSFSRQQLLDRICSTINEEEAKLNALLSTFDLEAEESPSSRKQPSDGIRSTGAKLPTDCFDADTYKDGIVSEWAICDKNQYLTTPIRLKYFPSLSPSVLRGLLSTPSMRVPTPDTSGVAADLAASAFNLEVEGAKFNGTESSEDRKLAVEANRGDELDHLPDNSRPFIPSRKAHVLTLDQSLCNRTDPEASAGLISTPENHRAVSPILIDSACRSMLDVRSPFPHNTLPNAYMRPKARSVKSNLHALAHQKSAANIALQHRVHEDLSCGVLRDFQRVIGELQGTSYEVHDTLDSAPSQVQSLIAAGPSLLDAFASLPETGPDGDGNCSTRQLDASLDQRVPETQLTDSEDTPDASQVRHASACPLHMEFAALLLNQAAAEESHARELVALADRLKRMAKLRRQLADVSTKGTV